MALKILSDLGDGVKKKIFKIEQKLLWNRVKIQKNIPRPIEVYIEAIQNSFTFQRS